MRTKTILAVALALIGSASFATEVSDFAVPTGSNLTRAEVRAELLRPLADQILVARGETYGNASTPLVVQRARAADGQVAGLSRSAVGRSKAQVDRTLLAGEAYGSVVPGAGLRSSFDVRAEAVTGVRAYTAPSQGSGT